MSTGHDDRPDDPTDGMVTARDLGAALRRRTGLVAAFVAVGAVVGAAAWMWSVPSYRATAVVTVEAISSDQFDGGSRPADLVDLQSEADLMASTAAAAEVRRRLRLDRSATDLLDAVEVVGPDGSLTLRVAATDPEPQVAQRLADAFAAVYLDRRQAEARATLDRQLAGLEARTTEQRRVLTNAIAVEQSAPAGSAERAAAAADAAAARSRLAAVDEARAQLLTVDTSPGRVAVVADRPLRPAGVPGWLVGLGVLVVAALAGAAAALLRDRTDPTLRDAREVGELVPGVPVDVLPVGAGASARRSDLLARLAVRVGATPSGRPARVLLAGVGERAPASVAAELVDTLAVAGRRTLAVWTGPAERCPGAADDTVPALGAVLRSMTPLVRALPAAPGWAVWLTAPGVDDLSALLRPDAAEQLTEQAAGSGFDVVLFVTPSPVSQAVALGVAHGATAVVVAAGERPARRDLADTVDLLAQVGVRPQEVLVG